jgi:hypothetical protein
MELTPREAAFVHQMMEEIENDEGQYPTARRQAEQIRQKAEAALLG